MLFGQLSELDGLIKSLSGTTSSIVSIAVLLPLIIPLIRGVIIFLVMWWIAGLVGRLVRRKATARNVEVMLVNLMARSVKLALLLLGIVMALGSMGFDVTALAIGIGLTGFAFGFAFREVLGNVLAGILILVYKPFEYEDVIAVDNFEGTVIDIDLRYTVLDTEGKLVFVPNSILVRDTVTVEKPAED